VPGITWFTNLDHKKRYRPLPLYEDYTPEKHPRYDNYDAVEVSRMKDFPAEYRGQLGVPITVFGFDFRPLYDIVECALNLRVAGKNKYLRIIIKRKT
jgi:hypothetical protein